MPDDGWAEVLAARMAEWRARRERERETRRVLAAARRAGLKRRYAEKKRRLEAK